MERISESPVELDGCTLTLEQLDLIARRECTVALAPEARQRVSAGRRAVERLVQGEGVAYGINTGFGDLASVRIPTGQLESLQERLVLSHAAGIGDALPDEVIR